MPLPIEEENYLEKYVEKLHKYIRSCNINKIRKLFTKFSKYEIKKMVNDTTRYHSFYGNSLHVCLRQYDCNGNVEQINILKLLLSYGANPSIIDYYEEMPCEISNLELEPIINCCLSQQLFT